MINTQTTHKGEISETQVCPTIFSFLFLTLPQSLRTVQETHLCFSCQKGALPSRSRNVRNEEITQSRRIFVNTLQPSDRQLRLSCTPSASSIHAGLVSCLYLHHMPESPVLHRCVQLTVHYPYEYFTMQLPHAQEWYVP